MPIIFAPTKNLKVLPIIIFEFKRSNSTTTTPEVTLMAFRWILVVATIALLASLSVAQTSAAMELVNKVQIVNLATSNEIVTSVRSGDTVYAIVNPLELYSVNLAAVQNNQTTTPVKSSISPEEDTGVAYALDASNSRLLISTFSVSVYDINLGNY